MKQFDHMIERKLNLELSNVFPRLSNVYPRLKFLAGCGQFSDFSNKVKEYKDSRPSGIGIGGGMEWGQK